MPLIFVYGLGIHSLNSQIKSKSLKNWFENRVVECTLIADKAVDIQKNTAAFVLSTGKL